MNGAPGGFCLAMSVFWLPLAALVCLPSAASNREAGRVATLLLRTPHAPRGVRTEVLLPPDWTPGRPAVLMVFLHDGRGSERSFRRHGLWDIALGMMRGGALPPMIVASPRYRGTFLIDSPRAEMESFLAEDLVPSLERDFPGAGGSRETRVAWGISMGGYGALKLALRHPELFGRAAALAPWVQRLAWDDYARHRGPLGRWLIEPVFGHSREESRFEANDLYRVAAVADPGRTPPLYVRTGGRDRWGPGADKLVGELESRGFRIDAASVPRARHAWLDWRRETPELLRFLAPRQTAAR